MDGGSNRQASRRSRALVVAGVFGALVGGLVVWQRLSTDPWDPVTAEPALPPSAADLSFATPDEALDNFLAAFDAGEYDLAADMLSSSTLGQVGGQIDTSGLTTRTGEAQAELVDISIDDAGYIPRHMVAQLAELAAIDGSLPIDLTGGITERTERRDGDTTMIDGTLVDGRAVTAVMVRNAAAEWRVEQLRVDGGDPALVPFSAPPGGEPPPRPAGEISRYPGRLPMDDAETFAVVALRLVETGDYFSLERVLGSPGWMGLMRGMNFDAVQLVTPAGRTIFDGWDIDDFQRTFAEWNGGIATVWRDAVELDAMYVNPVGPYTVQAVEPAETNRREPLTVVTVVDTNGVVYRVTISDVGEHGWRLHQILAEGGDPDILPLSGPTGIDVPPGMVACWDHVRYDLCDAELPTLDTARVQEIRDRADEGELAPAEAAAELMRLQSDQPDLSEVCATMQGQRDDLVFPQSAIDRAPTIVAEYCPGDPSLLVLDPES